MRTVFSLLVMLSLTIGAMAQNTVQVSGSTGSTTWTANNTYILNGYVFVSAGQVLTIEAGTVIKGAAGSGADASALIVAKGGQIFANGTEAAPIVFTYEADPLDGSVAYDTRGQWGGVIILGDASTNFGGPAQIEGIPSDNNQAIYGGTNDADNSGVMTYCSIRHGGTELGAANEINGLTLGGVGSATVLDHIEVVSNLDDGIEFFGGTVSITNALVAFCGDDSFDWDQGYRGQNNANWLAIQDVPNAVGDRGGELDGDDSDDGNVSADEMPFSTPTVNGWTVVSAGNNQGFLFRNGSGGNVTDGLICGTNEGIEIEDKETPEDAFDRWVAGDLTLSDIKLVGGTDALDYDGSQVADGDAQLDAYAAANGIEVSTMAVDYTFAFDAAGQQATDKLDLDVNQGSGHSFATGWSFCDERGMFVAGSSTDCDCPPLSQRPIVNISETGEGTGTTTWTCDNTYVLDGYVFVNSGQALTIEAGTVIKGAAGSGVDASALIVARGGQIFAEGGADCPIIFTYEADPLDGSVAYDTRGQWGGVIILGDASTNFGGPAQVEGIPADNDRAVYGGSNDADNSGVMTYCSIRHGGTELGAANEINGLTLGGVGSATVLDHIEVVSNLDDGIEFFGGTVSITNALVAFCGDDSFDWDQGYRGQNNANWLAIQDVPNAVGDRGGELDGDDSDDGNVSADEMPFSTPTVDGWTVVSAGNNQGFLFRNGSGGNVTDGLICGTNEGIEIEDKETPEDAFDRWVAGDLTLFNIKLVGGTDALDYDGSEVADGDAQLDAYAAANGIEVSSMAVDYTYAFDAAGQQATDAVDLDVNQGSGHSFAAGWTFCDERGLFADNSGNTGDQCDCPPLNQRPIVNISEAGEGTGTTTWTCDNTYVLDGYVFVNSGQALTIEAGTVIKGAAGSGVDASALIVARGGQIFAEGGADCPIIMTYEADPLDGSVSYDTRGQWGGLIILGDASTNFGGPAQVEGIPSDNDRAVYGGNNDADNSGILTYVSVRHGGTELGAANEINGITLGGVGSGTTMDHVEVISNLDDGIEFFGGTVSVTNAIVAFCGDDSFDWDQGYRGANNANWLVIQDQPGGVGDRGGELDGDDSDDGNVSADEMPFSIPTVNGWTVVGVGGNQGLLFRNGSGGNVINGLLTNVSEGIEIEDKETPEDAFDRWVAGDLTLSNIKVMGTTDALDYDGSEVADGDAQLDAYAAANGVVVDNSLSIDYTFAFDAAGQQATDKLYIEGGQGSGSDWTQGWSFVDERGLFADSFDDAAPTCDCPPLADRPIVNISEAGEGTGTTTWTCDNTYVLDGYVFVNSGQALTIEAGTVIKGAAGSGVDASALIVARGGQIFAEGGADCPIIMTYEADPLDGSVSYDTRGQWGGLIILGDASTNFGGPAQVEGIPADNDRAVYGGNNDADNSGILTYVSVRHGGTELGAANEINGITLGGVGSGTTMDHVEVISNLDDGIEFFGGTVSVTNAIVAFCGDDSFDWDQGYRGANNANWLVIQDQPGGVGDRGGELDGDDSDDGNVSADEMPFSIPTVNGWTVVGVGGNQGLLFRNGSGGNLTNGLLTNVSEGIEIEDKETPEDAFDRWVAGDLTLSNIKVMGTTDALDYDGSEVADGDAQLDAYAAANGVVVDNSLSIDYTFAFDAAGQQATDKLYIEGGQGSGSDWTQGWSFVDERGLFADSFDDAAPTCDCPPLADRPIVNISEAGEGTGTTTWTCDNTYVLNGYVFVNSGQALTIEAGTVIKGAAGSGVDASALIVARGGQIFAEGGADCPIIMTYEADPLDGSVSYDTRGQWGGLIILGDASTNFGGPAQVEGIPSDNDRAVYGGNNDADNSGILTYVSVRHGGTELGAANEINGITLGGVGSGTTMDHVEVISNLDDGIEFFGGTVSVTNAIVAFCGDDSFDWDQGYRGANNANWLVIQDQPGGVGDRGGELDGDDSDDGNVSADEMPFSIPTVNGWTVVGVGGNQGLLFRNGSGGNVINGLLTNVSEGIEIEDKETPEDAFDRWVAGDLTLSNIKVMGTTDALDYDGSEVADGDAQLDAYAAANGVVVDNSLSIDYTFAFDAAGQQATDKLYIEGGQGSGSDWTQGWSFVDERGLFAESFEDGTPLCAAGDITVSEAHNGAAQPYVEITNAGNLCSLGGLTISSQSDSHAFGDVDLTAGGFLVQSLSLDAAGDVLTLTDGATTLTYTLMAAYAANAADYSQNFDSSSETSNIMGCFATPTPGEANAACAPSGCGDPLASNYSADAVNIDNSLCEFTGACTDPLADNYDETALLDDGSCQYTVRIVVDMTEQGSTGASISIDGSNDIAMSYANFEAYSYDYTVGEGSFTVAFIAGDGATETIAPRTISIAAPLASDLFVFCFDADAACTGCTNPGFNEYNAYAMGDDASCTTAPVQGCTYVDAENYNAIANVDDGSCTGFGGGNDCPADLNEDGQIGAADLLQFLGVFGTLCGQ